MEDGSREGGKGLTHFKGGVAEAGQRSSKKHKTLTRPSLHHRTHAPTKQNQPPPTRRHFAGPSEHDVAVPPLFRTALVWGLFMGVSSNLRYQAVFGLERLVDATVARRVPQVAYATTVGIRFVNNVIGGENFIDMARWAGVQ